MPNVPVRGADGASYSLDYRTSPSGLVPGTIALTTVGDGRREVPTAGTRVQFAAVACVAVTITAEFDNTGVVVIGGSTCIAALATRRGTPLEAGDSMTLEVDNMNRLYIDSTVATDGVTFTYLVVAA